jgi:hypothetical protein
VHGRVEQLTEEGVLVDVGTPGHRTSLLDCSHRGNPVGSCIGSTYRSGTSWCYIAAM